MSVFATKFSPDLDSETLTSYMRDKLGRDVTCQKIETVQSRFGSFKITAECKEVDEMYNPELWPEGTFVRRFYEARKPKSTVGPMSVMNVPVMGLGYMIPSASHSDGGQNSDIQLTRLAPRTECWGQSASCCC